MSRQSAIHYGKQANTGESTQTQSRYDFRRHRLFRGKSHRGWHRTEARDIHHRQPDESRQRPLRPPLAPIHDPHRQPDAKRGESDSEERQGQGHARILHAGGRVREGV